MDISNWEAPNVTTMIAMFQSCTSLKNVDLSNLITNKVTKIQRMFNGCSNLESVNLCNIETNDLIWINDMFNGCAKLNSINFLKFNMSNVTDYKAMFSRVPITLEITTNESTKAWFNEKFPSYTNIVVPTT